MQTSQGGVMPRQSAGDPNKRPEADLDATLDSLVNYYATLPPGALAASVERPAAIPAAPAPTVSAAPSPRPIARTRTWPWFVLGATAMILGAIVTFVAMVGPAELVAMIKGQPARTAARLAVTAEQHAQDATEVPPVKVTSAKSASATAAVEPAAAAVNAVPVSERLADDSAKPAPAVARQAVAQPVAVDGTAARNEVKSRPAVADSAAKKRSRRRSRVGEVRTRRVARHASPTRSKARRAETSKKKARSRGSDDDWEDPFK